MRLNDIIAGGLALIVALSPLPLASNRPVYWLVSASFVFLLAGLFFVGFKKRKAAKSTTRYALIAAVALCSIYLGFLALQAFGMAGSVAPRASILALIRALSYATFFLIFWQVSARSKRAGWLAHFILLSVFAYALLGFFAHFGSFQFPSIFGPKQPPLGATATFVNPNSFASYLGFGLLLTVALLSRRIAAIKARGIPNMLDTYLAFYALAALLMLVMLVTTQSRMGMATCFLGLAVFIVPHVAKPGQSTASRALIFALLITTAVFISFIIFVAQMPAQLDTLEREVHLRFALYGQIWDMIMAQPWTGHGADSFELAFQKFHHPPLSTGLVWDKAHNSYLANWAETGLIFGSIPPLLFAIMLGILGRAVMQRPHNITFPMLGIAIIFQGGAHALTDFGLEIQANTYLFLAIIAITLADAQRPPKKRRA